MNNMINITNENGQLAVSSREVASNFDKDHRVVTRSIKNKIKSLTEQNCAVQITNLFIPTTYEHNGNQYKEYLLTRDGFTFIVMGFTGSKADIWKLKYIQAFNKMEQTIKQQQLPQTVEEMIIAQANSMLKFKSEVNTKFSSLEHKVDNQITLDHGKQRTLQKAVGKRVIELLNGTDTDDYRKYSKKYFAACYRDIKDRFGIPSYKDVKTKDYESALNYIRNWIAPVNIKGEVA